MAYPVNPNDAASKDYADYVLFTTRDYADYINNNNVRSDGSTPVTGTINMNGNTLYNVPDPVNPHDVATKDYVDKRPHIIYVKGSYFDYLIKDRYQFDFGLHGCKFDDKEENISPFLNEVVRMLFSGFLIPHSGRIKKITPKIVFLEPLINPSPLFSFLILKNNEKTETRLTDYILRRKITIDSIEIEKWKSALSGEKRGYIDWAGLLHQYQPQEDEYFFDNDFVNYPVSEGDIISIKTSRKNDGSSNFYFFTFLIELDPL